MAEITLKPITSENWRDCIRLSVNDDQKHFVAHNMYSLTEAAYKPASEQITPLAIYAGDTMTGFIMYGHPHDDDEDRDVWFIFRLMVDKEHQGKGYGRAAMEEAIKIISAKPDCDEIFVSYEPENAVAAKLYESLGFMDTGRMMDGETVVRLPLKKD